MLYLIFTEKVLKIEANINQIDINKLLSFIQSLATLNDIFLKSYIITIAKWADVLIISKRKKEQFIAFRNFAVLKKIITNLDNHFKENKKLFVLVEKKKLQENIYKNINGQKL